MNDDHDAMTGEVLTGTELTLDAGVASALVRAEIDVQIATARQYPRSIKSAINNILTLATLDEDTATECIYALKRGGKPIRGPSIRLADIIASQWGNCRDGAQVVTIDRVNKIITSEGVYHDLETNRGTRSTVQRRISDKHGRLFSDDMITVTGNAANSIARRNAILAGVPKAIWRRAVDACEKIIRGDAVTLVERRDGAIKALAHFNLSEDQIFAFLDVKGADDIDLDDLVSLRTLYANLKNGEMTTEEVLRGLKLSTPGHDAVHNPLKDEPTQTKPEPRQEAKREPEATHSQPEPENRTGEAMASDYGSAELPERESTPEPEKPKAEPKSTKHAAAAKANAKPVDQLASITSAAMYRDHALDWVEKGADVELMRAQWSRERAKRTDLGVMEDMLIEINTAYNNKIKALQKAAG